MREIKFRGKCIATGEWLYGDLSQYDSGLYITYISIKYGLRSIKKVKSETVGQYTGLKDKNGREIYEGDIIRIYNDEIDEEDSWIGEVSYHIGGFFSGDEDLLGNVHFRAKVIGNIYENPELLEGLK